MPETIGLDIGAHSIKLIGLKTTSKGLFLTCLGIKEVPPKTDKEDVNTFSETLKKLIDEVAPKTRKVNLVVSGPGVQVKRISVPSLPKDELKEAVRWEIKNNLPFPAEAAQIDFHILNEYAENNVRKLNLIVVACPRDLLQRTLSIAERAGLQPIHVSVAPFAIWNTLTAWNRIKKEENVALIDLGAEKTGIYLFKEEGLLFSREVTPAGTDITNAIIEAMVSEGETDVRFERAEEMKEEMGAPLESSQERTGRKSESLPKASFFIRPVLERLSAEIGRSFDYYKSQFNEEKVDKLLLIGGGANLRNIGSYLASELRLPVEYFNPLAEIPYDPRRIDTQLLHQMGSLFAVAAGVALSEPEQIELLPVRETLFTRAQLIKSAPFLAPGIALFIFLTVALYMNWHTSAIRKELNIKKAKLADLDARRGKLKTLKEKDIQLKEKLSQFPPSILVSVPYRAVLREVSHMVPDNITLTLLSVQTKGKPLTKGAPPSKPREEGSQKRAEKELHITGVAFGNDYRCLTALAQMIERFEKTLLLKNVRLISADEHKRYTQPGAEFGIVCDINLDNPPSPPVTSFSSLPKRGDGGVTNTSSVGSQAEEKWGMTATGKERQ